MAESQSMASRAASLAVSLVNPRFANFNKPLCLVIIVATLSVACFVPVLGYYMTLETVLVTDDSREDTALLGGPAWEVDRVLLEHVKLPGRCTEENSTKWFRGNGTSISQDGLTTTEYACDYSACILGSYNLGGRWSEENNRGRPFYVQGNPPAVWLNEDNILDGITWNSCRIQDEWTQGLVWNSHFILLHQGATRYSDLTQFGCKKVPPYYDYWCPVSMEAEAIRWIKKCCAEVPGLPASSSFCCSAENQASSTPSNESSACSLPGSIRIPGLYCLPGPVQERMDYVIAASARPSPSLYPICPEILEVQQKSQQMGNCRMDFLSLEPLSFKVQYIQRQTITTRTKAAFLTALSSALALTTYIEMAVTVVVILILRQLGCVREIKKFSWGEILNEQRDPELERKEMEERMQANVMLHLESQEKSLKGQQSELLGKVYFERPPVTE